MMPKALRLSSQQRYVLLSMHLKDVHILQRTYDRTRHALERKQLIQFDERAGRYVLTSSGADVARANLAASIAYYQSIKTPN